MIVRTTGIPGLRYGKDPGRFTATNMSLPNLITMAYAIPHYRLSAPQELNMLRFNIEARMPVETTKEQFEEMLRNLLAERFGLKVHRENRPMETYELVVAKNGPKLKDAAPDKPAEESNDASRRPGPPGPPQKNAEGYPIPPPGNDSWMAMMNGKAVMRDHAQTTADMAERFSNQIGKPVTDATGLKGKYDYTIYWSAAAMRPAAASPDGHVPDEADGPTLFQAIQEQLGLKLETKKGQVEMLVVDHVDKKPTEN
jgi:uncharacterized protein (TIGR03435 family)